MDRLLIAGAGVTGALCSSFLTNAENRLVSSVTIWDKGRGAGGRMSTSRSPAGVGSGSLPASSADLGAQYFTAMEKDWDLETAGVHKNVYEDLLQSGVLRPINGSIVGDNFDYSKKAPNSSPPAPKDKSNDELKHYVAKTGSSSVVKHFLQKSQDTNIQYNQTIESISLTEDGQSWFVSTREGASGTFDGVVLTMPVPQILQLKGDVRDSIDSRNLGETKRKLESVSYSSRFALAAWYGPEIKLAENVDWSAKYFYDDPCLRYIAIDPKKRGVQSEVEGTAIVVHTSVPFGLKFLENDVEEVKETIMVHVRQQIPELKDAAPLNIKCQRWRYSQVHRPFAGTPGCVVVRDSPLLVLAGDAFVKMSHFDGCVDSAIAVNNALISHLGLVHG